VPDPRFAPADRFKTTVTVVDTKFEVTDAVTLAFDPKPDLVRVASITDRLEIRELTIANDQTISFVPIAAVKERAEIEKLFRGVDFDAEKIGGALNPDGSRAVSHCDCGPEYILVLSCGEIELLTLGVKDGATLFSESIRGGTDLQPTTEGRKKILDFISAHKPRKEGANQPLQGTPGIVPPPATEPGARRP
jgi:hypothetical protein